MQLDALLASMFHYSKPYPEIVVQYKTTSKEAKYAYQLLSEKYKEINFIQECDFQKTLLSSLMQNQNYRFISFLVDDIIFMRKFDFKEILNIMDERSIYSLRLGLNLSISKIVNKPQELPNLERKKSFYSWWWNEGVLDWGYPHSLDGNIFPFEYISSLIRQIKFRAPNSLENKLSQKKIDNSFIGICSKESVLVNLPFNRVQNEVKNWSANFDVDILIRDFLDGRRIDFLSYGNRMISSVHEDWEMNVTG